MPIIHPLVHLLSCSYVPPERTTAEPTGTSLHRTIETVQEGHVAEQVAIAETTLEDREVGKVDVAIAVRVHLVAGQPGNLGDTKPDVVVLVYRVV